MARAYLVAGISHMKDHQAIGADKMKLPVWELDHPDAPITRLRGMFQGITDLASAHVDGNPCVAASSFDGNCYLWPLDDSRHSSAGELPLRTFHAGTSVQTLDTICDRYVVGGAQNSTAQYLDHVPALFLWDIKDARLLDSARPWVTHLIQQMEYDPVTRTILCLPIEGDYVKPVKVDDGAKFRHYDSFSVSGRITAIQVLSDRAAGESSLFALVPREQAVYEWKLQERHDTWVRHKLPDPIHEFSVFMTQGEPHILGTTEGHALTLYNVSQRREVERIQTDMRLYHPSVVWNENEPIALARGVAGQDYAVAIRLSPRQVTRYPCPDARITCVAMVSGR